MEDLEDYIKRLKTKEFNIDFDAQFTGIRNKIASKQRSAMIRNGAIALLLLIAVSTPVYLPQSYWNPIVSKDNYSVTSLINDDSGKNSDLSEYILAE